MGGAGPKRAHEGSEEDSRPSKLRTNMTRTKPAVQALESEENSKLLELVDSYRELGLNEEISLPQLVVVGDQSSGKSSLLEGMTGFNFPTGSGLCTRFATQIILRKAREGEESMKISILPGPSANDDFKEHLKKFKKVLQGGDVDDSGIAKMVDEAAVHMGLPPSTMAEEDTKDLRKRFSDDVLRIELYGPQWPQLSIVDVPGLFHKSNEYQTKEDMETIRTMIKKYAADERTIILAVMDGRVNLANQGVFDIAKEADPEGRRTVGVITKCDAIAKGDEREVLRIAQNQRDRLAHGWFVVKNRSTQETNEGVTIKQRHEIEAEFFKTEPWNALKKSHVGAPALTEALAKLLHDHIRAEFPQLLEEIQRHMYDCSARLEELGAPRGTSFQQRQYLAKICGRYEKHVNNATTGNYEPDWQEEDARKLRMHTAMQNERFDADMARYGHHWAFLGLDGKPDEDYISPRVEEEEAREKTPDFTYTQVTNSFGTVQSVKRNAAEQILARREWEAEMKKKKEAKAKEKSNAVYDWIRKAYRQSRGAELPGSGVNHAVLEGLFRQQAASWTAISHKHIQDIFSHVARYNEATLAEIVKDDQVRKRLAAHIARVSKETNSRAESHLGDLLRDELGGILQTVNHYYSANLSKNRESRMVHRLQAMLGSNAEGSVSERLMDIVKAAHLSNEDQAVNDIHDILNAYYKVARKRFVDNVVVQVVERFYLGEHGLVHLFADEYVQNLSDRELSDIAGENQIVVMERELEGQRFEKLKQALALGEAI